MHLTLNSQVLADLYGGSDDDACFILNDYLERHAEIILSLRDAFQSGVESLCKCIHLHAPTFSYIGIPSLTASCREFEAECKKAADTSTIKEGFNNILHMVQHSAALVREELRRLDKTGQYAANGK